MARCPGLRKKKAYAIVAEPNGAVYGNIVHGTPSCVFLQCCVCVRACMNNDDSSGITAYVYTETNLGEMKPSVLRTSIFLNP